MIKNEEKLNKLFQLSKDKKQRQKELERKKIKKIQDETRRLLLKKTKKEKALEKKKQLEKEKQNLLLTQAKRVFNVYLKYTKLLERDTAEDDLYQTREELQEAEKRGEGKINWDVWNSLVNKFRAK
jgi:hypothetical protein